MQHVPKLFILDIYGALGHVSDSCSNRKKKHQLNALEEKLKTSTENAKSFENVFIPVSIKLFKVVRWVLGSCLCLQSLESCQQEFFTNLSLTKLPKSDYWKVGLWSISKCSVIVTEFPHISCHLSISLPLENIRKPLVFWCFQGVYVKRGQWHEMD